MVDIQRAGTFVKSTGQASTPKLRYYKLFNVRPLLPDPLVITGFA